MRVFRSNGATPAAGRIAAWATSPILPALVFLLLALRDLGLPGLYMDAVNPDYLGVWITQPSGEMPAWIYPDNWLAPGYRLPLLNSLYGGATPAYVAAAAFQVFGDGLGTVRVLHVTYGLALLLLVCALTKRATKSPATAAAVGLALALDPSFVYAWRTQYYLQLFPDLCLVPAVLLGLRATAAGMPVALRRRLLALSGALAGFAAFGYFVYALYAVVLVAALLRRVPRPERLRGLLTYAAGFLVGYMPYLFAHASIIGQSGVASWWGAITGLRDAYGVTDGVGGGLLVNAADALGELTSVSGGDQVADVVLGQDAATGWVGAVVLALCVVSCVAGLVSMRGTGRSGSPAAVALQVVLGMLGVQLVLGTALGAPLQAQHYVALLPWFYVGLGVGLHSVFFDGTERGAATRTRAGLGVGAGLLSLLLLAGTFSFQQDLSRTGGRGWYSVAVNEVGSELRNLPAGSVAVFPQWGFWMGAAVIDGGRTTMWYEPDVAGVPARISREPRAPYYAVVLTAAQAQPGAERVLAAATGLEVHDLRDVLDGSGSVAARIAVLRRPGAVSPPFSDTAPIPGQRG